MSEIHPMFDVGYDLGIEHERERIIKLLEQELWVLPDGTLAVGEIYIPLKNAIALIKGEN